MEEFKLSTIAVVESCYKQKFGIPRQPGLVPSGKGVIRFLPEFAKPEAVEGLEQSSHIWVHFIFHGITAVKQGNAVGQPKAWRQRVRPPRLGGNKKIGVFATRSTHRPNPLGCSVVRLDSIDVSDGVVLHVSGIDFLNGTPVLDIKPYVPYADIIPGATNELAGEPPVHIKVRFSVQAVQQVDKFQPSGDIDLKKLIVEILQQDPRPAYQQEDGRIYATKLLNFDLSWHYIKIENDTEIEVVGLTNSQFDIDC